MNKIGSLLLAAVVVCGIIGQFVSKGVAQIIILCLTLICLMLLTANCMAYAHDLEVLLSSSETGKRLYTPLGKALQKCINDREVVLKDTYTANMNDSQLHINALQNQINPHFLYNTLECIRSEAIIQGCDNIAYMSHALASFFRYSISRRENIVTLRDELNNIRNYFIIQQFRFEDRFSLKISTDGDDSDAELQECLLPKMTIQPIVENSVFHGLEPKAGQGQVEIRIRSTENLLQLIVTDNGIGMDMDTLERMRINIESENGSLNFNKNGGHGNGIAMHNVNQRIKLIFGSEYGMKIYSSKNHGTQVEILIPIVHSRKELRITEESQR